MNKLVFNGSDYVPQYDDVRLTTQHGRIKELMLDGVWRTLEEISSATNDPASSVSAQLRHLRKERFGGYIVNKRSAGDRLTGLYEYQLLEPFVTNE